MKTASERFNVQTPSPRPSLTLRLLTAFGVLAALTLGIAAFGAVLVIVVVIVAGVALLRIREGENESEHGNAGGLERLGGLLQVLLLSDALAGDQHDAVG